MTKCIMQMSIFNVQHLRSEQQRDVRVSSGPSQYPDTDSNSDSGSGADNASSGAEGKTLFLGNREQSGV